MQQVPESQWAPSTGWGHPVHRVGGKDECPATEEVLPKHLLLLFCLFFDHQEQKIALIIPKSRHIIFNGACTTPLLFLVFHLFVHSSFIHLFIHSFILFDPAFPTPILLPPQRTTLMVLTRHFLFL